MVEPGGRRGVFKPVSYLPYDVVVVPFPYSDRLAEKRRPALVVSAAGLVTGRGLIWVAMITSALHAPGFGDHRIRDLPAAGLPVQSLLRAGKIATIEPTRILRKLGALAPADRLYAEEVLKSCAAF